MSDRLRPCLPAASALGFFDWLIGSSGYQLLDPHTDETVARLMSPHGRVVYFTLPPNATTLYATQSGCDLVRSYNQWLQGRARPGRIKGRPLRDLLARAVYAHGTRTEG